jgi:YD repeat-containing protein
MRAQGTQRDFGEFYDSFSTRLIKEFETDDNGFFQVDIPVGRYTITVVENGKLYTFGWDQYGGISSVTFAGGKQKADLTLTYEASF